ncbi:dihydrolipoyl dehydrogenase [Candidatus Endolissoclinum faulkneri L5]|uniref:Dihydrolipoyl dehydrogenase n=1 Tax=Candidatus Endolissoclinum faulkneri L5 TaxID=1401328 RepID=V9TW94_9PROT|nr:dihydrolipoyl dehydrogenase [Candidatus Endolissoclinum faulkneri]AHC73983.1 dihydrolipoyl dehydrogenase [Candidatus Endolissoclinum faulkneri L5]
MSIDYDVVVIGSGPGGYVAAIRGSQLGLKIACVEQHRSLGGTCLNIGCIPSKALLNASEKYLEVESRLEHLGIEVSPPKLNINKLMKKKTEIVNSLTEGINFLFKKNNVDWLQGVGKITEVGEVEVIAANGDKKIIKCQNILIATGSTTVPIPGIKVDEKHIVTSTGALNLRSVPQQLIVIGGGVIGLELGSVWKRFGAKVTVVEFLDRIISTMDQELGKLFKRTMERQGIDFKMSTKVTQAKVDNNHVELTIKNTTSDTVEELNADIVLVATGRRPYYTGLGLEELGVRCDKYGFIQVDQDFQTSIDSIYAIGDVINGPMLAHKAEEDAITAVEIMVGQSGRVDYNLVPMIIYTSPEVASVGRTEEQLQESKIEYCRGVFPFFANSRARANVDTEGQVKILADKNTHQILGAHIIGPNAGTLIHEICVIMEFGGSAEDIARICHGHPTLNEAIKEAAMAIADQTIHI